MANWKTTLVGALLAAAIAIKPLFDAGQYDYKMLGLAALIALLSYLAKDHDVTGGTVANK